MTPEQPIFDFVAATPRVVLGHLQNWREHLPLEIDRYERARRADVEAAIFNVLARTPEPIPAPAPALYEPAAILRELPADVPHIYGLCGKPKAGKDVVADYIVAHYRGVTRLAFSDAIRDEVNAYLAPYLYPTTLGERAHHVVEANKSDAHYRHILQAWAMGRRDEDPHYWTKSVKRKVREDIATGERLVIATGVRMPTDVEVINELDGDVLRVVRPGNPYRAEHEVEAGLDHTPDEAFLTIYNSVEGDIAPYEDNIEAVLHGLPQPYLPALADVASGREADERRARPVSPHAQRS